MAEFATVMHEMKRMCDAFIKKDECWKCLLSSNSVCGTPSNMDYEAIRKAEVAIMAWAAEHPKPTYPTWGEWFVANGMLIEGYCNATNTAFKLAQLKKIMDEHISADIAEKLGIEPKED